MGRRSLKPLHHRLMTKSVDFNFLIGPIKILSVTWHSTIPAWLHCCRSSSSPRQKLPPSVSVQWLMCNKDRYFLLNCLCLTFNFVVTSGALESWRISQIAVAERFGFFLFLSNNKLLMNFSISSQKMEFFIEKCHPTFWVSPSFSPSSRRRWFIDRLPQSDAIGSESSAEAKRC